jgi:hypothetical protein
LHIHENAQGYNCARQSYMGPAGPLHLIHENVKLRKYVSLYIVATVPDHGRPSISGPIRSIKMHSWAQCTVQKRLLCSGDVPCVAQEEQGFGPSTLSTYPLPISLG